MVGLEVKQILMLEKILKKNNCKKLLKVFDILNMINITSISLMPRFSKTGSLTGVPRSIKEKDKQTGHWRYE